MTPCLFCRILTGELPSSPVLEDDLVVAILDIHPANPGHALIVPRRHVEFFTDLTPKELEQLARAGQRVATALKRGFDSCEAVTLSLADGAAAGQDVPHTHLHVVPRRQPEHAGLLVWGAGTQRLWELRGFRLQPEGCGCRESIGALYAAFRLKASTLAIAAGLGLMLSAAAFLAKAHYFPGFDAFSKNFAGDHWSHLQAIVGSPQQRWYVAQQALTRPLVNIPAMKELVRWVRTNFAGSAAERGQKQCASMGIAALSPDAFTPEEIIDDTSDISTCRTIFLLRRDMHYLALSPKVEALGFRRIATRENAEAWMIDGR